MDQPNNLTETEQEISRLESQLNEAAAAERFFESASGKLINELIAKEVTRLTRDMVSDKYIKDHTGYMYCLAELRAWQGILKRLQVAASPVRRAKIQERLDDAAEEARLERKSS
jgi:hypothetical protein